MNRATPATGWARNPDGTLGFTFNPITGCLNGCPYCYARRLANGRLKARYLANKCYAVPESEESAFLRNIMADKPIQPDYDPFYPRFWPERIEKFIDVSLRGDYGVFVCDMSDLFGIGIPDEWQDQIFQAIDARPACRFYLLTKQPQNLQKFSPFPDNCWVGVSVTTQKQFQEAYHLARIDAKIRFLSIEPLLEQIDISKVMAASERKHYQPLVNHLDWLIIGAQTKPTMLPQKLWVDEITEACTKAGIPYFLKDNLRSLLGNDLVQEMPKWKLRQELAE